MAHVIHAVWARRHFRPPRARAVVAVIAAALLAAGVAACGTGGSSSSTTAGATGSSAPGKVGGSLTVWVDSVRLPAAQAYAKAHPDVHVKIVTFDGDGNGATTLQAKIQLWNRTGNGWPDVIFSEQVNDPVWMAQKPFDFAANLEGGVFPTKIASQIPKPSIGQCTVNGHLVCIQDNLAPEVL